MPRKEERVSYYADIMLESSSRNCEARITDISLGGCFIDSIVAGQVGDDVVFEFREPIDWELRFTGTVVYVLDGIGFGLTFKNLTRKQKAGLKRIIKTHGTGSFTP
jgi:hypothetical protein